MTKNSSFSRFVAVLSAIAHRFGVQWVFAWLVKPDTCLRAMIKYSAFSRFMAVFMSYCPQFCGSRAILINLNTRFFFESCDQNLDVLAFYGWFHELLPIVLGFHGDLE